MTETAYEDRLEFMARNACQNCGVSADLHRVHESATPFYVCDECYAEIDAVFAREDAPNPADHMVIAAMRKPARMICCNCQTTAARWNSLYCSESCKREFLTFPEVA